MKRESQTAPVNKFVILAAPRTGSNLLCTLLHSHPNVLCHHEIFNLEAIYVAQPLRATEFSLGTKGERRADPLGFLARMWHRNDDHTHVGFKMTNKQNPEVFEHVCGQSSIHKIILQRQSQIKTYVSRLIAESNGIWEDYDLSRPHSPISVRVDAEHLFKAIDFNQRYYEEMLTSLQGKVTQVSYEQLFQPETQHQLLMDLELPTTPLVASSRHINPFPLSKLIENFDELKSTVSRKANSEQLMRELECETA